MLKSSPHRTSLHSVSRLSPHNSPPHSTPFIRIEASESSSHTSIGPGSRKPMHSLLSARPDASRASLLFWWCPTMSDEGLKEKVCLVLGSKAQTNFPVLYLVLCMWANVREEWETGWVWGSWSGSPLSCWMVKDWEKYLYSPRGAMLLRQGLMGKSIPKRWSLRCPNTSSERCLSATFWSCFPV